MAFRLESEVVIYNNLSPYHREFVICIDLTDVRVCFTSMYLWQFFVAI